MGTGGNPCAEWWAIKTSPSQHCSSNTVRNCRPIFSVLKEPYTAGRGTVSGSRTGVSSRSECEKYLSSCLCTACSDSYRNASQWWTTLGFPTEHESKVAQQRCESLAAAKSSAWKQNLEQLQTIKVATLKKTVESWWVRMKSLCRLFKICYISLP